MAKSKKKSITIRAAVLGAMIASLGAIMASIFPFLFTKACDSQDLRIRIISRHENGQKKIVGKYKGTGENEKLVERYCYDAQGKVVSEENLRENTKKIIYRDEKGNIDGQGIIKAGIKNGKFLVSQHKNGRKREEIIYANGKPQKYFYWNEKGGKIGEGGIINGKRFGKYVLWHDNGQKKVESEYKDNAVITSIEWDKQGNKLYENKIVGKEKHEYKTEWHAVGKKKFKLNTFYIDGKLKKIIQEDRDIRMEAEYNGNKLHGRTTHYWFGKIIYYQEYRNGKPFGQPVIIDKENYLKFTFVAGGYAILDLFDILL